MNSFALSNKTLDVSLHIDYAKTPTINLYLVLLNDGVSLYISFAIYMSDFLVILFLIMRAFPFCWVGSLHLCYLN